MQRDVDIVKKKVSDILNKDILLEEKIDLDRDYSVISPSSHLFYGDISCPKNEFKFSETKSEFSELLKEVFLHQTANPSENKNKKMWELIYSYGTKSLPKLRYIPSLNSSEEVINNFIGELLTATKKLRKFRFERFCDPQKSNYSQLTKRIADRTRYIVLGDRGAGKTTFINYLLATKSAEADKSNTILIRHDVHIKAEELTLSECIKWKLCKVLFKYYDSTINTPGIDYKNRDLLFDLSSKNQFLRKELELCDFTDFDYYDRFRKEVLDTKIPKKVDHNIFKGLHNYLTLVEHNGYERPKELVGFVYIIDNLDKLGLSPKDIDRYDKTVSNIMDLLFDDDELIRPLVIVMRHNTYLESNFPTLEGTAKIYTIKHSDSYDIYEKRLKYLQRQDLVDIDRYPSLKKMRDNDYSNDAKAICDAYLSFIAYSLSHSLNDPIKSKPQDAFIYLDKLFGQNKRALFKALSDWSCHFFNVLPDNEFDDIITESINLNNIKNNELERDGINISVFYSNEQREQKVFSKYYFLTEALMLGSYQYLLEPYGYEFELDDNNDLQIKHGSRSRKGHGVPKAICNLWHYPFDPEFEIYPHVFTSIRIMQYLKTKYRYKSNRKRLVNFLVSNFRYNCNIVNILIDELLENNFLRLSSSSGINIVRGSIELSERGIFLMDRFSQALEYNAIALETTALPSKIVINNNNLKMEISHYYDENFIIKNKIITCAKFISILKKIEAYEEVYFNKTQLKSNQSDKSFSEMNFKIMDDIEKNVLLSINKIIDNAFSQGDFRLINLLRDKLK